MASILPSIPRMPNPPGTRMPSTPAKSASAPPAVDLLGLDAHDQHPRPVGDARVVERLVDRLVGVAVLHVLADHGDPHLVLGVHDPLDHARASRSMSSGLAFRRSRLTRISSSPLIDQAERHLVDAELLVALFDDRLALDVAEQGDLVLVVGG